MPNNNDKKRWGRRVGATACWTILITAAFYICLFGGKDLSWFTSYTQYAFGALGFLVGGLTITDAILKK